MNKLIKSIIFSSLFFIFAASANAESLNGNYGACISEELFNELTSAANKKDENAWQYLLNNGCIITKKGIKVSVLDRKWTGIAKIRAYVGKNSVILWTNIENINKN